MRTKKLCKIEKGEIVSGVCMGFSAFFGIDVTIIRLIFLAAIFFSVGSPILVYIVLAIILPTCDPNEVPYEEVYDEEEDEDDFYNPNRKNKDKSEEVDPYFDDDRY